MKIKGMNFIITGGNRGIGLAVAEMAAVCGANIYIASRSWSPDLEKRLRALGAPFVKHLAVDLSTFAGTEKLAEDLKQIEVDILFNNAGLLTGGLIENQDIKEIYDMLQVNIAAPIHLSRAVIPGMVKRGRGKIINNSSVSAFMHFPCASTYAASKAALVAFTDSIELELAGTGVTTLSLITPGIKTRMFDEIDEKYSKNFETPKDTISPAEYALQIRKAVETDQKYLLPKGATAVGLFTAKYLSPLFRKVVKSKFRR